MFHFHSPFVYHPPFVIASLLHLIQEQNTLKTYSSGQKFDLNNNKIRNMICTELRNRGVMMSPLLCSMDFLAYFISQQKQQLVIIISLSCYYSFLFPFWCDTTKRIYGVGIDTITFFACSNEVGVLYDVCLPDDDGTS